jgi:hypothetical protein
MRRSGGHYQRAGRPFRSEVRLFPTNSSRTRGFQTTTNIRPRDMIFAAQQKAYNSRAKNKKFAGSRPRLN